MIYWKSNRHLVGFFFFFFHLVISATPMRSRYYYSYVPIRNPRFREEGLFVQGHTATWANQTMSLYYVRLTLEISIQSYIFHWYIHWGETHVLEETLRTRILCASAHNVFDSALFCWKTICLNHKGICSLSLLTNQASPVSKLFQAGHFCLNISLKKCLTSSGKWVMCWESWFSVY